MLLSTQFMELFREETYAVNLELFDHKELTDVFEEILVEKPIEGLWDKEYSVVPMGALGGRMEANPIPLMNMTMGYQTFGAQASEAAGKVSLSNILAQRSREFRSPDGTVDEPKFAGFLADTISRGFLSRKAQRWHRLNASIFNLGGIQAGDVFFNQRVRANGLADVPNTNLLYDGSPLFALPTVAHPSYAAAAVVGPGTVPVGICVDMGATIPDTGGYFNAFILPPSYWALKRVVTHFIQNMSFDENDERYLMAPDTLLISGYDEMRWMEILESRFIEPTGMTGLGVGQASTNRENVFKMENYKLNLVVDPFLVPHTWYVGKAKAGGIIRLNPAEKDDPWAYYRDEDNRAYFISYEAYWGFMIRNWRQWCAGAISLDGVTPPAFNGVAEAAWDTIPAGV